MQLKLRDMPRDIDDRKKRKALRKLRKAAERAEAEGGPGLSEWEKEFVEEVEARLETYGSAFADPDKGSLDEPLSARQSLKLKEIDKKARGKGKSGFRQKSGLAAKRPADFKPRGRDINDDIVDDTPPTPDATGPRLVEPTKAPEHQSAPSPQIRPVGGGSQRPMLRVIKGDKA
ncbi:MAG: hypothetical protein AAFQ84_02760 [Pseudomonadota bacterium]